MNSAQGKLGQVQYDNVHFGGITVIRDKIAELKMQNGVSDINVRQILTDNVDLFEMRWTRESDKWLSQGNTVRLPSYIMAVARS